MSTLNLGGGQGGQQGGQGVQTSFRFFVNGQEVDSNNGSINIPMNSKYSTHTTLIYQNANFSVWWNWGKW